MFEILYFSSIEETKQYWEKLELYGSFFYKYEFYKDIYDLVLTNKLDTDIYSDPNILVGIENNKVVGILCFITQNGTIISIYSLGLIGSNLPVKPKYLHKFLEQTKICMSLENIGPFYLSKDSDYGKFYYWMISNTIDLRNLTSIDEYIAFLPKKKRQNLKKIINLNKTIIVKQEEPETYVVYQEEYNKKHWIDKGRRSISLKLLLYGVVFKYSKSVYTLSFYNNEGLIAINKSYIENNILLDYVCIRPTSYNNFIGHYAIYKNIEFAIQNKISYYELGTNLNSDDDTKILNYKRGFINQNSLFCPSGYSIGKNNTLKDEIIYPPYYNGTKWVF